jgi:hypothetical protein
MGPSGWEAPFKYIDRFAALYLPGLNPGVSREF